jgi:DNA-binding response OmpR family regulator
MTKSSKVLIIDDDKWIAMSTAMILEGEGFEVLTALSGAAGIEMAAEKQPGFILLDIMMPGMDGWETLKHLQELDETAAIPVAVFTAREHPHGRRRASDQGAVAYFRKPFRPQVLVEFIREHTLQPSTTDQEST